MEFLYHYRSLQLWMNAWARWKPSIKLCTSANCIKLARLQWKKNVGLASRRLLTRTNDACGLPVQSVYNLGPHTSRGTERTDRRRCGHEWPSATMFLPSSSLAHSQPVACALLRMVTIEIWRIRRTRLRGSWRCVMSRCNQRAEAGGRR